jgi:hypothetical protein
MDPEPVGHRSWLSSIHDALGLSVPLFETDADQQGIRALDFDPLPLILVLLVHHALDGRHRWRGDPFLRSGQTVTQT